MSLISRERLQELFKYNPQQSIDEIEVLIDRLSNNGELGTILELGIGTGGTLKIWEQLLPQNKNSLIISIDIQPNVEWVYENSFVDIRVIKGSTNDHSVRQGVKDILNGRKVDFLFIDTRHWNDAVKEDLLDYGGFVRDNGIIALHDIAFFHSYWDKLTWEHPIGKDNIPYHAYEPVKEKTVFHKEEIKTRFGIGILWKMPNQNVVKFKEI